MGVQPTPLLAVLAGHELQETGKEAPVQHDPDTAHSREDGVAGTQFNRKKIGLNFGLKNDLRFHFVSKLPNR